MRIQSLIITSFVASLLTAAVPVTATTVVIEFSGHVTSGIDNAGLFGAPGTNLAGSAFTATSSFDMPYARYTHYDVTSGFDAHVLINGHDYAVPYVVPPPPYDVGRNTTGYWAFGTGGTKYGYAVLSTWLFTPLAHFFAGGNADNFVEANGSISGSVNNSGDLDAEGSLLRFATTSFKLTPPPALPEPASWALMVSGFGMVGAAMRRQRPRHANSITSL